MNRLHPHGDPGEATRLIILMMLMGVGMIMWNYIFEAPKQRAAQRQAIIEQQKQAQLQEQLAARIKNDEIMAAKQAQQSPNILISSPVLDGYLSLRGNRINYLVLKQYKQTTAADSPPVLLLKPSGGIQSYFAEFGWLSSDKNIILPDSNTVWQEDSSELTPENPVTLRWDNGNGLLFETRISIVDNYLFAIEQKVTNNSGHEVQLLPYGFINRTFEQAASQYLILHEGPIGVLDGSLTEISYKELNEKKKISYSNADGWLGITDKYWLTALSPHNGETFTANFKAYRSNGLHRYQADFLGRQIEIASGESQEYKSLFFAGAKELELLDKYAEEYDIPLFDRAVDLGFLYFLTKPLLILLTWLYKLSGDFGTAIILLTVLVKLSMYPLANKSYVAMNEMKRLQPKLQQLKEQCGDDKMRFNQEMMKIYKREKINPAAGCLPLLIQIPVFFALYKVLFVTIEMRHANFYGLIEDLSASDPTNIFTLFGLLDWNPPSLLHLGILPILMAVTMWAQQQLNPKPTDPVQAKVMSMLPWIFMIILAKFPAGLLVYWVWSNLLSIAQQWAIKHRYAQRNKKRQQELAAKAANDD